MGFSPRDSGVASTSRKKRLSLSRKETVPFFYTGIVYTETVYISFCLKEGRDRIMKNITLSADENLIEAARQRAAAEHTTLNERFRVWLEHYVRREQQAAEAMRVIRELQGRIFTGGRTFTRDQMNER